MSCHFRHELLSIIVQEVSSLSFSLRSALGHRCAPNGTPAGPVCCLECVHDYAADSHTNRDDNQVGGSHEDVAREEHGHLHRVAVDLGANLPRGGNNGGDGIDWRLRSLLNLLKLCLKFILEFFVLREREREKWIHTLSGRSFQLLLRLLGVESREDEKWQYLWWKRW